MKSEKDKIKNIINGKLEWSEADDILYIKICNANIVMMFYDKIILAINKRNVIKFENKPDSILNENDQLEIFDKIYSYVCNIKRHPFKLCEKLGIDYLAGFQDYLNFSDITYEDKICFDIDYTYTLHNRDGNTVKIMYDITEQCKISCISISNQHYSDKDFVPIESILVSSIINYLLID